MVDAADLAAILSSVRHFVRTVVVPLEEDASAETDSCCCKGVEMNPVGGYTPVIVGGGVGT